ncbi:response regulator [Sphingobacterium rhinopitheci]|uniref:response regulator n=1 Tax=Sphingobacterium rhinopitheci TaxID=2781960 RepID=UPI001F51674C|nr:response regulator [Sphingobacterium rhinopitheci]MCI0921780.1 response regulator [Sphingobacterium rhinopitheci]
MYKTVLILDDDKAILDIFTLVLEASGYLVHVSETSHDIINKVELTNPDVIIMDNWIPDIGGIEATNLLKKHKNFKHIPVIYCSANSDIAYLAEKAGAQAYLSKPFDLNDLENLVAKMLEPINAV